MSTSRRRLYPRNVLCGLKEKRPGSLVLPGELRISSSQNGTSAPSRDDGSLLVPTVVGSPFFAESRK